MKTLQQYEDEERLVKLIAWDDGTFCVTIILSDSSRVIRSSSYVRLAWAFRKFIEYRDFPLKALIK